MLRSSHPQQGISRDNLKQQSSHRLHRIFRTDIAATKNFYTAVFGWKFTDYGLITQVSKMAG